MLSVKGVGYETEHHRHRRREQKLWHDGRRPTLSLGCSVCQEREICGGLRIGRALFDCLDHCCRRPGTCDSVCRIKPGDFARRVREVSGFWLDNVPRAAQLPGPDLPSVVPVLYSGSSRQTRFSPPAVCLKLYSIIERNDGTERYSDPGAVARAFQYQDDTPLILTGTAEDAPLERWWSLGTGRVNTIRKLRELGVKFVTTPNFSLFTDRPRWDDMHSMKRIAITHEEFLREGIPAALHLNARTERDWERWTEFIQKRPEITHVAFEFATGAGWSERIDWHAGQLIRLAQEVGRPLHLVVRAANGYILSSLVNSFAKVTVLDTTSYFKTIKRQRAIETENGRIVWERSPTAQNAPLDKLLIHNWSAVRRSFDYVFARNKIPQPTELV